jgi:hypothetical protein
MCAEQIALIQTIGLISVGLGQVIFAYFLFRVTKKQNEIIEKQKNIMDEQAKIIKSQADISSGLLIIEELSYLERLYASISPQDTLLNEAKKEAVMGVEKGKMPSLEDQKEFHNSWIKSYSRLVKQTLDRVGKNLPS